jgi:hypothetical protein
MQCVSCQTDINPQWAHAIETNICPFCGQSCVDQHLKNLLSSLRQTMAALQQYPEQLNDWLLSNHNYIKTDSPNLLDYAPKELLSTIKKVKDEADFQERKKFTVKIKDKDTGQIEEVQAETLQSADKTNSFFERAQVLKKPHPDTPKSPNAPPVFTSQAEKTQYLKEQVQQIKKAGVMGSSNVVLGVSSEMLEDADPDAVADFAAEISGGTEVGSAMPDMGDEIPGMDFVLEANQALAAKKGNSSANAADLLKLQQMRQKQAQSRANFESGENRGRGGGFSRSG